MGVIKNNFKLILIMIGAAAPVFILAYFSRELLSNFIVKVFLFMYIVWYGHFTYNKFLSKKKK